ncbi:hypothetical protein DOTSEDRAFT_70152 [Dothistroma septosporum NZE10]|uniref:Uncharacterized protein n=1 Tax=Dothistroma septosporum (strain NZE10 / CBS 128990) TaxID=675120 RepID=N1PUH8_DOTSN|nr:hypothetical protein DOTSEDRAFT_70152 [Dothistroma septosporum NZE10]
MTRTTRASRQRPDLTQSWDDVDNSYYDEAEPIYDEGEERDEVGEEYRSRMKESRTSLHGSREEPRRRSLRSSVEPGLVMPASPDAAATRRDSEQRAPTPHMRMNQRSMTSDAGQLRKAQRSSTPRMRLIERSMTSDAGVVRSSRLKEHQDADYDSDDESATLQYGSLAWENILRPLLQYASGVVGILMQNLKPVFAFALLAYLLAAGLTFGAGFLNNSINHALSPICRLPFTDSLPFCPLPDRPELKGTAEFDKLVQAQDAFQDVLASASTGVNLPLDMKRSEASVRDLKHVVQYSSLPSRNELVFEFTGFIDTARQASQDLSKFNSRIGRAVDHILSTNRWTLSVIDGVSATEASRGSLSKFISNNLDIFTPFRPQSLSREPLMDQYLRHTGAVEEQIQILIEEALALRDILENLDGRLDVIHDIATRDDYKLAASKEELFATLWSKLGGNRSSKQKLENQLQLLKNVDTYRRTAWAHVTATIIKLQEIQHSLEDLRERVGMPEVLGDKVPLEVHIESINLGIERLEHQRDAGRRLEAENYARVIEKGATSERRMLGGKEEI